MDIVERLRALIPELEFGRGTHIDWAEWFEGNPDDPRIASLGDAKFHRKMESEYDNRLGCVTDAKSEIKRLRALTEWQPIETLEDDYCEGEPPEYVDVYVPNSWPQRNSGFMRDGKVWANVITVYEPQPTHWKPTTPPQESDT